MTKDEVLKIFPDATEEQLTALLSGNSDDDVQAALQRAKDAEKSFQIQKNRLDVERQFLKAGIAEEDYSKLIDSIGSEDGKKSTASAEAFIAILTAQKEKTEKEIKAELLKQTPRPGGGKDGEDGDDTEGEALAKQLGAERAKTAEAAGESMKHYMGGKS